MLYDEVNTVIMQGIILLTQVEKMNDQDVHRQQFPGKETSNPIRGPTSICTHLLIFNVNI